MAATTMTARTGVQFALFGHAAQFKGLADVGSNRFLQSAHVVLGIQETARDRIFEKAFAKGFECVHFFLVQRGAGFLLLLQFLASIHELLILPAGLLVGHEDFDVPAHGLDFGLIEDGLAQLAGLLVDSGRFSWCRHKYLDWPATGTPGATAR